MRNTVNRGGRYFTSGEERDNTIHIEFVPAGQFYSNAGATAWNNFQGNEIRSSYIQFNKGANAYADHTDRRSVILLAHEIMHALGLSGLDHPDPAFDTILEGTKDIYATVQGKRQPLSILYPVDREALRALYGRFANGDSVESLGPWINTSMNILGNGPHAAFGVALRNGYAEPWAYGQIPDNDLDDNRGLNGSAKWEGTILGLTPQAASVAGDASINVNLTTLAGQAYFTSLEQWAAGTAPGDAGSGTQWLDGDLGYSIVVRGNTFRETGGDDGSLTGIFVGRQHEGAAGTLERDDLTAAFGVSR